MPFERDNPRALKLEALAYLPGIFLSGWWILEVRRAWESTGLNFALWILMAGACGDVWKRWPKRPRIGRATPTWMPVLLGIAATPFLVAASRGHSSVGNSPTGLVALSLGWVLYLSGFILLVSDWKTLRHFLLPMFVALIIGAIPYFLKILLN